MAYQVIKQLPTSNEIITQIPLSELGYQDIERSRQEIKNIISGADDRLLVIVGPCSAWPYDAVLEYANRLLKINEKVNHALKLV
ncbi:MAG: 3-deoxy-7-phosphoheptulonate synthase, partial [Burkholderiales bacterium]